MDISTAVTGFAVVSLSGELVELGHIDLTAHDSVWDKADAVAAWARALATRHTVGHVFVEQSLQAFRPGFSSAATLSSLTRFNGIVSYIVRDITSVDPEFVPSSTARSLFGVKIKKGKGHKSGKEQAFDAVTSVLGDTWPRGRTGKVKPWCYDEADSYVIAVAGRKLLNSMATAT